MAYTLNALGKYAAAQPLYEKALDIRRRLLAADHSETATSYALTAYNLRLQGKYARAQPLFEKALDIRRRLLTDNNVETAASFAHLASNLSDQGRHAEADPPFGKALDIYRRPLTEDDPSTATSYSNVAFNLYKQRNYAGAQPLHERALEIHRRLLTDEHLDTARSYYNVAANLDAQGKYNQAQPIYEKTLEIHRRLLTDDHPITAFCYAGLAGNLGYQGRHADAQRLFEKALHDDTSLAIKVRAELRSRPGPAATDLRPLVEKLRNQRLAPLAKALGATADGQPSPQNLIILPSAAMSGVPIEALLAPDDSRNVSYAPSATVYKYLLEQPRPDRRAGLLALGDPVFERPDQSSDPKPMPERGLLVNAVLPGSNAATHGLKPGDVLLAYNGRSLSKKDEFKAVADSDKPIPIEVWRNGVSSQRELAPGKLGIVFDPQPAPVAIAEQRKLQQTLASARGGSEKFNPLPGTRSEVEALKALFDSDKRPTKILLAADASEPEIDRLATSGELGQFGFIHLATHGVIDEAIPQRSAVILTQTGLPDPLEQVLNQKSVFDGRLSVREIQRGWNLKAELVTLSACETALGREAGGEGFVGFTQALLMSGTRSVCLSLWKVDDKATASLMQRFYANLLGRRSGLAEPMPKAAALAEAKAWLRGLTAKASDPRSRGDIVTTTVAPVGTHPFEHPHYWAGFILVGDPD